MSVPSWKLSMRPAKGYRNLRPHLRGARNQRPSAWSFVNTVHQKPTSMRPRPIVPMT